MSAALAPAVRVDLGDRGYPIFIGEGLVGRLGELYPAPSSGSPAMLVADTQVHALYGENAITSLESGGWRVLAVQVPGGEESKSLEMASRLYDQALEAGLERASPIVALGGGVVGDLAGFVAATLLRGVSFVQVPTTLLAQVDSSVGGKVGVNHPRGKNLIGAFYQPVMVVTDVATLRTLPFRQVAAGLAEVVKHGVIADTAYFEFLENSVEDLKSLEPPVLERVVEGSCRIKAAVVESDERERGKRAILNFGHTLGHALEVATGYGTLLHGEAVAVGMSAATRLAVRLGLCSPDEEGRIETLLARLGLPTRCPGLPLAAVRDAMALDKKRRRGELNWVLPTRIGSVKVTSGLPPSLVDEVLLEVTG